MPLLTCLGWFISWIKVCPARQTAFSLPFLLKSVQFLPHVARLQTTMLLVRTPSFLATSGLAARVLRFRVRQLCEEKKETARSLPARRVTLLLKNGYRTWLVKFSKTAIAIRFNLLLSSFVFTVLFILSFNGLSGYVCVSLNLVATFSVLILMIKVMLQMMLRNDSLLA